MSNPIFNAPVGNAQFGDNNNANVQQNIGASAQEVAQLFAQMRLDIRALPQEQQAEAVEIINELEEQTQKEKPKPSILKSLGTTLWGIAAPVLTEGAKAYLKHKLGVDSAWSPNLSGISPDSLKRLGAAEKSIAGSLKQTVRS